MIESLAALAFMVLVTVLGAVVLWKVDVWMDREEER